MADRIRAGVQPNGLARSGRRGGVRGGIWTVLSIMTEFVMTYSDDEFQPSPGTGGAVAPPPAGSSELGTGAGALLQRLPDDEAAA